MGKKFLDQEGLRKIIQSISQQINQKLNGKISTLKSANSNHIVIDNTDASNPVINLNSDLVDKINTMWDIINNGTRKEETPAPFIDFIGEKISNLIPNALFSVNGTLMYANSNGEIALYLSWVGSNINIVKKSTGPSRLDSDNKLLFIPARPATPVIYSIKEYMYGIDTTMEYRKLPSTTWNNVTATSLKLPNGSYDVRIKATETSFASECANTVITTGYISVTDITGVPTRIEQTTWDRPIVVNLGGVVVPNNATVRTIVWNIMDDGGTGPSIVNGNKIQAWNTGIMGLQATINKGINDKTSYIKYFNIEVVPPHTLQ